MKTILSLYRPAAFDIDAVFPLLVIGACMIANVIIATVLISVYG